MDRIPSLGFGTYGRTGSTGIAAIGFAIETGYRHIDTAQSYGNESEVGAAVSQSDLPRDQLWVTTKIDTANFATGRLIPSLERSIETLGGPVDLTLIHWPSPNHEIALPVYLDQIAKAQELGLTRFIGVSNFTIDLLKQAQALLGQTAILTNQIELNPLFKNKKIADHCQSAGILITCYQPIAKGRLSGEPTIEAVAKKHAATSEQVALAWELAKGYVAIPTSSKQARIRSNFEAMNLALSAQEIAAIDALSDGPRAIDPQWGPEWD